MYYYIINKPFGYLSQFTREEESHKVLGDLHDFPPTVYPVGRLDKDSEGLLVLTDDKRLNSALLSPARKHPRTYWVRVEGTPTEEALEKLRQGVEIKIKKKVHRCLPLQARVLPAEETAHIQERNPPVRYRKNIPDAWLELKLTEGKNRQVRRMCAAVDLPVLRLIRVAIEDVTLKDLEGETVRKVDKEWLLSGLKL
ncbi:MAG: 23S rRNA pseudouridine2457 synthase [Neolewinella sp.]|jgi:23S rRNA pseudouridine2457 synthase